MDFFNGMDSFEQTLWYMAFAASLAFVIQMVMTFVGGDASDGANADFDGDFEVDVFQLFSLRNLTNFLLGFSWGGITFYETFKEKWLVVLLATLVGAVMVALFFVAMRQIKKLSEDNSFRLSAAVGKSAQVYLTIPASKTGKGKIHVSVNGATHELEAVTAGDRLDTGMMVKVVACVDELLVVEKI